MRGNQHWLCEMLAIHDWLRQSFCEAFSQLNVAGRRTGAADKARRGVEEIVGVLVAMLDAEQECLPRLPFRVDSSFASCDLRWGAEQMLELLRDQPLEVISEYFCLLHSELLIALHAKERDCALRQADGLSAAGRSSLRNIYSKLAQPGCQEAKA